jgi:hypothetical protein
MMPLPRETPADALRRVKGIDLGVLMGGSRGVKVLKPMTIQGWDERSSHF